MAESGPGGRGTRHISKRYPVTRGIIAGTTKTWGTTGRTKPQIDLSNANELIGL